jgi:hypothetical protein
MTITLIIKENDTARDVLDQLARQLASKADELNSKSVLPTYHKKDQEKMVDSSIHLYNLAVEIHEKSKN